MNDSDYIKIDSVNTCTSLFKKQMDILKKKMK